MELDPIPIRILGCLVEKERTTPDYYPMTANALQNAANQKSNREPVMDISETDVLDAVTALREEGLVRAVRPAGGRSVKYKHALADVLSLDEAELSVLAVLLLRGEQTPGELRARTERYHEFPNLGEIETTLESLIDQQFAERLGRRPGEKEARYRHLLGTGHSEEGAPPAAASAPAQVKTPGDLEARVRELEERVAHLEERLRSLLGNSRTETHDS